jgi:maltose alpha-D-glucosyltransferase/alpha-amylase
MQWTAERHGGFSRARKLLLPAIAEGEYGYKRVNVVDQRRDPHSLLNRTERMIRARRECPEISWGQFTLLETGALEVLALRYDWRNTALVTAYNFAGRKRKARLQVGGPGGKVLVSVFDERHSRAAGPGVHEVPLEPYGYRWFRVGAADNALDRTALD